MSKKYLPAGNPVTHRPGSVRVITNDLFLAAFLCTVHCDLARVEKNERRRVSFVFVGDRVKELREAYRAGPVRVDMRSFRDNLNVLRNLLGQVIAESHPEKRSVPCPEPSLMQSSRA